MSFIYYQFVLYMFFCRLPYEGKITVHYDGSTVTVCGDGTDMCG